MGLVPLKETPESFLSFHHLKNTVRRQPSCGKPGRGHLEIWDLLHGLELPAVQNVKVKCLLFKHPYLESFCE